MRIFIALAACLLLAACVKTVTGPDGQPAFYTRCTGTACFRRPAEKCPQGYTIISDQPVVIGSASAGTGFIGTAHDLAFTCK